MNYILDVYRSERAALDADLLGTPEHVALRHTQSAAAMDDFKAWLLADQGRHPPHGPMGDAISYALGNWASTNANRGMRAMPGRHANRVPTTWRGKSRYERPYNGRKSTARQGFLPDPGSSSAPISARSVPASRVGRTSCARSTEDRWPALPHGEAPSTTERDSPAPAGELPGCLGNTGCYSLGMNRWTGAAIIAAGSALRLWQYFGNPSLWLDEAFLAHAIMDQPLSELLTGTLYYSQVAPKGFLLVERALVAMLGRTDLALRLFPLACSIAAMPLLWLAARRILSPPAALLALSLLALSPGAVFFVQVKQYATDMLACSVLLLAGLDLLEGRRVRIWAITGAVLAWMSQPAAFVLAGIAALLVALDRHRLDVALPWLGSALAAGLVSLRSVTDDGLLHQYWADGWMPFGSSALPWGAHVVYSAFGPQGLALAFPLGWAILASLGVGALCVRKRLMALLIAPLAVAAVGSALRVYPLSGRLLCFAFPVLVILAAAGVEWIAARLRSPQLALLAAAPAVLAISVQHPVRRFEDVQPALAYIERAQQPDDLLYVYYAAEPAFRHYRGNYMLPSAMVGAPLRPWTAGDGSRLTTSGLDVLEKVKGHRRAWLLFVHERANERAAVLSALDTIGRQVACVMFGGDAPANTCVYEIAAMRANLP